MPGVLMYACIAVLNAMIHFEHNLRTILAAQFMQFASTLLYSYISFTDMCKIVNILHGISRVVVLNTVCQYEHPSRHYMSSRDRCLPTNC